MTRRVVRRRRPAAAALRRLRPALVRPIPAAARAIPCPPHLPKAQHSRCQTHRRRLQAPRSRRSTAVAAMRRVIDRAARAITYRAPSHKTLPARALQADRRTPRRRVRRHRIPRRRIRRRPAPRRRTTARLRRPVLCRPTMRRRFPAMPRQAILRRPVTPRSEARACKSV
jgi:hypothetical protein